MAQTRRIGKRNQRANGPKAPRFSYLPNYVPFLLGLAFLLLKLTHMGDRRITGETLSQFLYVFSGVSVILVIGLGPTKAEELE
jgi:hypothetical protein